MFIFIGPFSAVGAQLLVIISENKQNHKNSYMQLKYNPSLHTQAVYIQWRC